MASYHRSIRLVQQDKLNIGNTGTVLQFLWHFCTTGMYIAFYKRKKRRIIESNFLKVVELVFVEFIMKIIWRSIK